MELALTGDTISAERAHHFGMINDLCEPGAAVSCALELAARINANAPLAARASRQLVLDAPALDDREGMRRAAAAMGEMADTHDFAEGPRAFIEKRPPQWQGR